MHIAVCVSDWGHERCLCKRDDERIIYPDFAGHVGYNPHKRFLESERDLGHADQLRSKMKAGCPHRWRDKWAGHAGLRPSADIRGVAAVEFALILLPLLLMVLGIIDGGRMLWTQNSLQYAVEQAARYAGLNQAACTQPGSTTTCYTTAQIQSYAVSMAYGMSLSSSVFSSSSAGCGTLVGTQVSASYTYTPLFPFPSNVQLTASSCRPT
jgi:Flp pilus assembly protein TadG